MEDLSAYPGLIRKPSGVYAVRMRVPTDIVAMIESDPKIWNAMSVNRGSSFFKWRSALMSTGTAQHVKIKTEFKRSLNARKLSDAKPAYFDLRSDLEALFGAIRAAYSREQRAAAEADLVGLSENFFSTLEVDAEENATALIYDPDERANAQANIQEEISDILSGHPSAIGYH